QTLTRFDGLRRPTQYAYDLRGNITRIVDPLGNLTRLNYDIADNVGRRIDPDRAITDYDWDAFRNVIERVDPHEADEDPADFTTRWTRLPDGRPLTETLPTGGTIHWEYDENGNETFVRDDAGDVIFARTYGPNGRLETYSDRFGT